METVIKQYIRDEKTKQPRGVAVAVKTSLGINYGFSLINSRYDKWNSNTGTKIALARANAIGGYQLPSVPERKTAVLAAFQALENRALRYFKDLNEDQVKFECCLDEE